MTRSDWRSSGTPQAASQKVLLFAAAGLPLGVSLEEMLRVVDAEALTPLPHPHPALRGVLDTREGVCPVYDLAALGGSLEAAVTTGKGGLVALFPHPAGSVGLAVDRLAGLADQVDALPQGMQRKLIRALPSTLQQLITGAATSQGQLFFFFSRDAFLSWVATGSRARD
jgi:chemotaxis signal transduction protein